MQEIISAIDIGTTKICTLTAGVTHDSLGNLALRILGEGQAPSRGIRRGVVVNVQEATAAIAEAVERCEADMGQRVVSAYVGIAGAILERSTAKAWRPLIAARVSPAMICSAPWKERGRSPYHKIKR
ncbi:MAG: cell division protein FtsA [Caldilineaceae bacterium]